MPHDHSSNALCKTCAFPYLAHWCKLVPGATVVIANVIENKKFDRDVILIANEMRNIRVVRGRLFAFASSYIDVEVASGCHSMTVLFVKKSLRVLNSGVIATKTKISIKFLFESSRQQIVANGKSMSIDEYLKYWVECAHRDNVDANYKGLECKQSSLTETDV
jgi:hypothetical protein